MICYDKCCAVKRVMLQAKNVSIAASTSLFLLAQKLYFSVQSVINMCLSDSHDSCAVYLSLRLAVYIGHIDM